MGLDGSSLVFHPLFVRTRHTVVDSHSWAGDHRSGLRPATGKGSHLLPFCRRRRILLLDLLLSGLGRHIRLRQPFLYLLNAYLHFWPGAPAPALWRVLPLFHPDVLPGCFRPCLAHPLERRIHFSVGCPFDSRPRPCLVRGGRPQPVLRRPSGAFLRSAPLLLWA